MDKERTVAHMAEKRGRKFSDYTPEQQKKMKDSFQLDVHLEFTSKTWRGAFRQGPDIQMGEGLYKITESNSPDFKMVMQELGDKGEISKDEVSLHFLSDRMVIITLREGGHPIELVMVKD